MFLISLFGLAAAGGAALAISDAFSVDEVEENEDDGIEDSDAQAAETGDVTTGNLLDPDDTLEDPIEPDATSPGEGDVVSDTDGNLIIEEQDGVDILTGQDGNDQINGFAGDDQINGGAGNDILHGDVGADVMTGGEGQDILHGEDGNDTLLGGAGEDALFGHMGDDDLDGGEGDDRLHGGQGADHLEGGEGDDALQGGGGDDFLTGGAGQDTLFGGDGDDVLIGTHDETGALSSDFLNGGEGDDFILAGEGDIVTGGEGTDTIALGPETDEDSDSEPVTIVDFAVGQDKLLVTWDNPTDPQIDIRQDDDQDNLTKVLVNGQEIARLLGAEGLSEADIQLVSEAHLAQFAATGAI